MENNKNQTIAYLGTRSEGSLAQAKRPDLNEINKRNAEEERQARKSLYFTTRALLFIHKGPNNDIKQNNTNIMRE